MYPQSGPGCCSPGQFRTSERRLLTPSQSIEEGSGLVQHCQALPPPSSIFQNGPILALLPLRHTFFSAVCSQWPTSSEAQAGWKSSALTETTKELWSLGQRTTSITTMSITTMSWCPCHPLAYPFIPSLFPRFLQVSFILHICVGSYLLGPLSTNSEPLIHLLGSGLASDVLRMLISACLSGSSLPLPLLLSQELDISCLSLSLIH